MRSSIPKSINKKSWVVIGAGLHGVHIACRLLEAGVPRERIALLDALPPLALWSRRTARLEIGYLRSAVVHHIDVCPWSLLNFVRENYAGDESWCAAPYQRPRYDIFQAHCENVLRKFAIDSVFSQESALSLESCAGSGYLIRTDRSTIEADQCVLALGQAPPRLRGNEKADHLLSWDFDSAVPGRRMVVVGTGMTGVQFALSMAGKGVSVTLCGRRTSEAEDFDADPCWIGPRCLSDDFRKAPVEERRRIITESRKAGTLNAQVQAEFSRALMKGELRFREGRPIGKESGRLVLDSGESLECDRVVWATGFEKVRPGGSLVSQLIKDLALPVSPCGFPVTTPELEWAPRLYVTGGLAELTLGPLARNIMGARAAGKIIAERCRELEAALL